MKYTLRQNLYSSAVVIGTDIQLTQQTGSGQSNAMTCSPSGGQSGANGYNFYWPAKTGIKLLGVRLYSNFQSALFPYFTVGAGVSDFVSGVGMFQFWLGDPVTNPMLENGEPKAVFPPSIGEWLNFEMMVPHKMNEFQAIFCSKYTPNQYFRLKTDLIDSSLNGKICHINAEILLETSQPVQWT